MTASVRGTVRSVFRNAGPGFVLASTAAALATLYYTFAVASVVHHRYVHMVVGLVWIGTNLLLGVVLEPVLENVDAEARVAVYRELLPKLAVVLPLLLVTTVGVGIPLSVEMGLFAHPEPWLAGFVLVVGAGLLLTYAWRFDAWRDPRWIVPSTAVLLASLLGLAVTVDQFGAVSTSMLLTLVVGGLITFVGLGLDLSGTLRACLELQSQNPDADLVTRLGHQTVLFARVQVFLQVVIVISVL